MVKSFKTFLKHAGKDFYNQSVNPPVVRASTLIFKSIEDIRKTQNKSNKNPIGGHFTYGREGSSTTFALQQMLRKIEESYQVFLTPTGFGSVFLAIFSVVRPGNEILLSDPIYSPTRLLTENFLKEFNIKAIFYDPNNINDLKNKISKKTKLIFVENPGSNTFEFQDLGKIISLAKKNNIFTAIDNTWGTPYFLQPLNLGFDMSIVAATKYYSGHSDVMGGSLAVNKKVFKHVYKYNKVTTALGFFMYGGFFIHIISLILFVWDPIKVNFYEFILITIASILINMALFLATLAFKTAQKHYSSVFCLVYLQIVWSVLIGLFIFNEYLNLFAIIGALLIVMSGIFSIPAQFKQIDE